MSTVDIATIGIGVDSRQVVNANKDLDKMDAVSKRLTGTVKNLIGAWAGWKVIKNVIIESALLNARFETMGIVMNGVGKNAGYSSTQMKEYELQLRKTGIAMIEARETLTRMAQAQLDLSKTSQLARVAQDAAVIGGINSSEAFERMVNGIQTAQVETLRTIGINVNFQDSYVALAKQLGINENQLTETQKAQARMNAVLEYGSRIAGTYEAAMGTAGKQLQSMKRYIDDLKVKFGEVFNEALTAAVFGFSGAMKDANHQMDELARNDSLEKWGKSLKLILLGLAETINSITVAAEKIGVAFAHQSVQSDIRDTYDRKIKALGDDGSFTNLAAKARAAKERDAALAAENELYRITMKGLGDRYGAVWRAGQEQEKAKDKQRADDLNKERKYLENLAAVRKAYANSPLSVQQEAMKALASSYYPNEPIGFTPAASAATGSTSSATKTDPLKSIVDATEVKRLEEYSKLLSMLNARYGKSRTNAELLRQAVKQLGEQYDDVVAQSVFDGAYKAKAKDADFIKSQQDDVNQLESDIAGATKAAIEWQAELNSTLRDLSATASGNLVAAQFNAAEDWLKASVKTLTEMKGISPDAYKALLDTINKIAGAKFDAGALAGVMAEMQKAQEIVASTEASLQSRVITGLVDETAARVKLREAIGAQGDVLSQRLLPTLKAMLAVASDEKTKAGIQANIDKINEMVAVGQQTTFYQGLTKATEDYAKASVDSFQTAYDATKKAFKGMEDALVEFITTGKASFSDFANSIIKDITRIFVQQNITQPLASSASGLLGNVFSWLLSANGNAFAGGNHVSAYAHGGVLGPNGGIFPGPTIFPMANGGIGLAGEAGDEAAMPLKRLSNGKLGVHADNAGKSGSVAVSVTINDNRTVTESKAQAGDDKLAPRLGELVKSVVQAKLMEEMRPGGLLAS